MSNIWRKESTDMSRRFNCHLTLVAVACSVGVLALFSDFVWAQKRAPRRPTATRQSATRVDYSKFSHAEKKHQANCNTCHKVPTSNWQTVRSYPDTADYPGHEACVSCHRAQFFKSARPVICTVCHTKVSPRDDARFAFRDPAGPRQFNIEFPHDKHQDVIAQRRGTVMPATVFVRVSFVHAADDRTKTYNNCEICHAAPKVQPAPAQGWPDAFVPDASTFKSSPLNHAACFNCHWKSQAPVNNNCAGCHKLADKPYVATDAPKRISLKFRHLREQHIAECTTCHINITKAATLRGLKPDVPMTACTECHNKDGLRQDVNKELEALDKNRDFVCSYCHTSDVGRLDPPASHYTIAGRAPLKRKDLR
jgi:hypothetical protein